MLANQRYGLLLLTALNTYDTALSVWLDKTNIA